jgi:prefoldin beta subunit
MDRDQIEKLTKEYQMLQDQLQSVAMQKEQFTEMKEEFKEAMAEIEKSTGKIYSSVGGVMIEVTKDKAIKDMKEKQESTDMRFGIVSKQYEDFSKKEQALRASINAALKDYKEEA